MQNALEPQTASPVWLHDLKAATPSWVAARVDTFLSHYWREGDDFTAEAVLADWVNALKNTPREAIENGIAAWLAENPRQRPRPGDILAKANDWIAAQSDAAGRAQLSREGLTGEEERVVKWAVETQRLGRHDAIDAVKGTGPIPDWLPQSEAQIAIYRVRHHPRCMEGLEQPSQRKRNDWGRA